MLNKCVECYIYKWCNNEVHIFIKKHKFRILWLIQRLCEGTPFIQESTKETRNLFEILKVQFDSDLGVYKNSTNCIPIFSKI